MAAPSAADVAAADMADDVPVGIDVPVGVDVPVGIDVAVGAATGRAPRRTASSKASVALRTRSAMHPTPSPCRSV
ncbi:hypothetical protein [Streptomyces typhae]|uniref:hypothetical protein n=1 Tax=Streptomyces typhae TaxID=2681492 RepID=UPI0031B5F9A6